MKQPTTRSFCLPLLGEALMVLACSTQPGRFAGRQPATAGVVAGSLGLFLLRRDQMVPCVVAAMRVPPESLLMPVLAWFVSGAVLLHHLLQQVSRRSAWWRHTQFWAGLALTAVGSAVLASLADHLIGS